MKLVCDEGVERPIVDALRAEGHDVSYVAELQPGTSDDEVLDIAAAAEAVVVTTDKDFGELVFRQGRAHHGVVLLRLHGLTNDEKARIAARGILAFDLERGTRSDGVVAKLTPIGADRVSRCTGKGAPAQLPLPLVDDCTPAEMMALLEAWWDSRPTKAHPS